jgi:hypothetical protein
MGAVVEDVEAARKLPQPDLRSGDPHARSREAYLVRQRVKRVGFTELRSALVRFAGTLTVQFLQLDKEIEDFAGQWREALPMQGPTGVLIPQPREGVNAGLSEQLDHIEQQALALRDQAAGGMKLCRDELANELINLEP